MKLNRLWKQFNWRFLLVRILVNAIALAVTVAIVPKINFVDASIRNWLFMAIMLGVLNALVKPLLQFLTLQFIFVTFGLVVVIVNALILMLLSLLFPNQFSVSSIWWALLGGLVLGVVSSFFESLLGLTMPIVPDEPDAFRGQVEAPASGVNWAPEAQDKAEAQSQAMQTEGPSSTDPGERLDDPVPDPGMVAESEVEPGSVAEADPDDSGQPGEPLEPDREINPDGPEPPYSPQEGAEEDRS